MDESDDTHSLATTVSPGAEYSSSATFFHFANSRALLLLACTLPVVDDTGSAAAAAGSGSLEGGSGGGGGGGGTARLGGAKTTARARRFATVSGVSSSGSRCSLGGTATSSTGEDTIHTKERIASRWIKKQQQLVLDTHKEHTHTHSHDTLAVLRHNGIANSRIAASYSALVA